MATKRKSPSLLGAYAPLAAIVAFTALIVVLRNTGEGTGRP